MRVTEGTNFNTIRDSISRSRGRMEKLQHQSATLKKINTPSDDPVGSSKVLEIRTDKVNNEQFVTNAKLASAFLNNTDHALGELADVVVRAKEIALGQSSGASTNDDTRIGIAEEVHQLFQQAVSVANRRIGERYLFGGYKTHQPPVDADGKYRGDDGEMMVEISKGVFIGMNLPGHQAFNTQPGASWDEKRLQETPGGKTLPADQKETTGRKPAALDQPEPENVNVFDELQSLRIALLSGDIDGIRNTLDRFDTMHAKLISMRAKAGSRLQGIDGMEQSIERQNLTNAHLNSVLEDADMAQVVSDLAKEETVFRSALASSQKLMQPTLLDFLK